MCKEQRIVVLNLVEISKDFPIFIDLKLLKQVLILFATFRKTFCS